MGSLPGGLRFDLSGDGVQVECITGRRGDIALNLKLGEARHAFGTHRNDRLGVERLKIGTLLTVPLLRVSEWDRFSLLLPDVEPTGFSDPELLRTIAIRTQMLPDNLGVHDTRIPTRVVQSFQVFQLDGTVATRDAASMRCPTGWLANADGKDFGNLTVAVVCTFPSAGYGIELRRAESQGSDRTDLWLQLTVRKPTGHSAITPTRVRGEYKEQFNGTYKNVTILPDGPRISIQLEEPVTFP